MYPSAFDINYQKYLLSVRANGFDVLFFRRDIKVQTSIFCLIQECVARFPRPAARAEPARRCTLQRYKVDVRGGTRQM